RARSGARRVGGRDAIRSDESGSALSTAVAHPGVRPDRPPAGLDCHARRADEVLARAPPLRSHLDGPARMPSRDRRLGVRLPLDFLEMTSKWIARFLVLSVILCWTALARAQLLSPGPLAGPHAGLEGDDKCNRCHSSERGVSDGLCLGCHGNIGA